MLNNTQGVLAVMIAHNELEYIKAGVAALLRELSNTGSEIVIVDNCSNDGLQEWLLQQDKVSYLICDEKIEGYGFLLNMVIKHFGNHRDMLLLRSNYVFVSGSIAYMEAALHSQEDIAAIGPICESFSGEQKCVCGRSGTDILNFRNSLTEGLWKTAYLEPDVLLIKGSTLEALETDFAIPQAVLRGYMKKVINQGFCLAIEKKAICFALNNTQDEIYYRFDSLLYKHEKIHQLFYRLGEIAYKGVFLFKYLKPEILSGINLENNLQNITKNAHLSVWLSDEVVLSTEREAEQLIKTIEQLPQKPILFMTLPLRRMFLGKFIHTTLEPFISSLDENQYLNIEYSLMNEDELNIPTKNRYPITMSGIPRIYGIEEVESEEIARFIANNFIVPIENVLGVKFDATILSCCTQKACFVLKTREAYIKYYQKVFIQVKPKVVIYSHGQNVLFTYLRDAALEAGIPTLEIAHGVVIEDVYHKHLVYADDIVVYNEITAQKSREHGNDRVFVVGKPGMYDHIVRPSYRYPVIVISFISSIENEIFNYAVNLAKRLDKQKYIVTYKPHSSEIWTKEEVTQVQSAVENFQFMDGGGDIREVAEVSDIVVGIRSSGIFDVLPYSMVKIIAVKDIANNYNESNPNELIQEMANRGEIVLVDDEEQLYQEVLNYKRNVKYRNEISEFWPADAGERFRKLVDRYL